MAAQVDCTVRVNNEDKSVKISPSKSVADLLASASVKVGKDAVYFAGGVPVPGDKLLSDFPGALPTFCAGRSGITVEEIGKNKGEKGAACWMVLDSARVYNATGLGLQTWVVYDVTEYLDDHPGGKGIMMSHSGAWGGSLDTVGVLAAYPHPSSFSSRPSH